MRVAIKKEKENISTKIDNLINFSISNYIKLLDMIGYACMSSSILFSYGITFFSQHKIKLRLKIKRKYQQ